MNIPELVAVPPGVVMLTLPVRAPVGTVAVSELSRKTLNVVAATPPKVTFVAPVKLLPVMVTEVPTGPLVGEKLLIFGITRNLVMLERMPLGVVTVTGPVRAPVGTLATR